MLLLMISLGNEHLDSSLATAENTVPGWLRGGRRPLSGPSKPGKGGEGPLRLWWLGCQLEDALEAGDELDVESS